MKQRTANLRSPLFARIRPAERFSLQAQKNRPHGKSPSERLWRAYRLLISGGVFMGPHFLDPSGKEVVYVVVTTSVLGLEVRVNQVLV